jgi:hypothetical protein
MGGCPMSGMDYAQGDYPLQCERRFNELEDLVRTLSSVKLDSTAWLNDFHRVEYEFSKVSYKVDELSIVVNKHNAKIEEMQEHIASMSGDIKLHTKLLESILAFQNKLTWWMIGILCTSVGSLLAMLLKK